MTKISNFILGLLQVLILAACSSGDKLSGALHRLTRINGGKKECKREAINFNMKLNKIADSDLWSPKVVAEMNDYQLKLVKVQGDFTWHDHKDTDEVFIVIDGSLRIDFDDGTDVTLNAGEMYVVPKGVVHKPYAESLCKLLLVEPHDVINTGEVQDSELTSERGQYI